MALTVDVTNADISHHEPREIIIDEDSSHDLEADRTARDLLVEAIDEDVIF